MKPAKALQMQEMEDLPPDQLSLRRAFFDWQERGFGSAWESLAATAKELYGEAKNERQQD